MKARKQQRSAARRVIASLAVAASVTAASAAHATIIGGITISGTRYVNGIPTKVRCTAAGGNTIDATNYGVRIITLQPDPGCDIWWDTGLTDQFEFVGREDHIIKGGVTTETLDFSGVQTLPGPGGVVDAAKGAVSAILKCVGPTCVSEKGSITYSRTQNGTDKIIFVGTYKAGF